VTDKSYNHSKAILRSRQNEIHSVAEWYITDKPFLQRRDARSYFSVIISLWNVVNISTQTLPTPLFSGVRGQEHVN